MSTSWESSHQWYDRAVGEKGHYYHQAVILPNLLRLLDLKKGDKLLDLGCGQGVLARQLGGGVGYCGVDASSSLIKAAKKGSSHTFLVHDVTRPLPVAQDFTHAVILLALQNIEEGEGVIQNCARHLLPSGKLIIVLNHPCFRIPRQSSWGIDEAKKLQYRRLDRYFSPLKIPIQTHPSQGAQSSETFSFHRPLSTYTQWLKGSGFGIRSIEEWCSDKKSVGKLAKMEDRCRAEFPLFLTIVASL